MNTEAEKAARERRVVQTLIKNQTFIEKSRLQICSGSVEGCKPPKPDILCCEKKGGKVAFELVEICAEDIARVTSAIGKEEVGEVVYVRSRDPSRDVLHNKLKKRYQTEYPIELLCYTSGRIISPDIVILEAIRPIIDMDNGQFRRIWLLGDRCHLVWPSI